jgi:hypothetical protein
LTGLEGLLSLASPGRPSRQNRIKCQHSGSVFHLSEVRELGK